MNGYSVVTSCERAQEVSLGTVGRRVGPCGGPPALALTFVLQFEVRDGTGRLREHMGWFDVMIAGARCLCSASIVLALSLFQGAEPAAVTMYLNLPRCRACDLM